MKYVVEECVGDRWRNTGGGLFFETPTDAILCMVDCDARLPGVPRRVRGVPGLTVLAFGRYPAPKRKGEAKITAPPRPSPEPRRPFYIVSRIDCAGPVERGEKPAFQHPTCESARGEARRLAANLRGRFVVAKAVLEVQNVFAETPLGELSDEEIPF